MSIRLSSFGMGRLMGLAIVFVGAAVYHAVQYVDHALFYRNVTATVTAVESVCGADGDSSASHAKIDWFPCGDLASAPPSRLTALHLRRSARVRFSFVSPADGQEHQGLLQPDGKSHSDWARYTATGQTGSIWASNSDPAVYKYDRWPFGRAS